MWCLSYVMLTLLGLAECQTNSNKTGTLGMVITAYVFFGLGALLILIGLVRLIYYISYTRKEQARDRYKENMASIYQNSPWLKGNKLTPHREAMSNASDDVLRDVDMNAFYLDPSPPSHVIAPRSKTGSRFATHTGNGSANVDTAASGSGVQDPLYAEVVHEHRSPSSSQGFVPVTNIDNDSMGDPEYVPVTPPRGRNMNGVPANSPKVLLRTDTELALDALTAATAGEDFDPSPRPVQGQGQPNRGQIMPNERVVLNNGSPARQSIGGSVSSGSLQGTVYPTELILSPVSHSALSPLIKSHESIAEFVDRTLAEDNEIEYTFSSTVYVQQ